MHIHILGICGTFMGGVAQLAQASGHRVTGCDANVYPPMSDQLASAGIELIEGYDESQLALKPDMFVIGNAISRGNRLLEAILEQGLPYTSGPQWLGEQILSSRHVLAVAGTHGKTTTSSLLAWILEHAGMKPSFLIGGVPSNFRHSARLTDSRYFVIEADEYDTCFFDKRSKFVHYRPKTAILNNLEYDHADIFPNLAAIETQFHHLIRTMARNARLVVNDQSEALHRVLDKGLYSELVYFNSSRGWHVSDGVVCYADRTYDKLEMDLVGRHNQLNALAAIAAAEHVGVPVEVSLEALQTFSGVKRRMEVRGVENNITIIDDFAHHPTAIAETLLALRTKIGREHRILVVIEPRSNTMKMGTMKDLLAPSLSEAEEVICFAPPTLGWDVKASLSSLGSKAHVLNCLDDVVSCTVALAQPGDYVLVMSNGGFGGIHDKLLVALKGS